MKTILEAQHAVGSPNPRGIAQYTINLIQALLRRDAFDYEITFFDYNKEIGNLVRAEEYFGKYNASFRECNELDYRVASRDDSVFLSKSYNDYTKTNGDIYHFMSALTIPTNLKGKMICTVHDLIWESFPDFVPEYTKPLYKLGIKRIEQMRPFIIVDSNSSQDEVLQFTNMPKEQIKVVYASYDEENMYPDQSDVSNIVDGDYIFFVGALEKRKNIVGIVSAFNRVAEKYPALKLVIAGKSDYSQARPTAENPEPIYESVRNSPYADRIIMPGYVDIAAKRRLLSNAIMFVFPSFCEGFGIPVLEAMACGCPVITADNTSLPEVGGDAALYVNAHDVEQLAHEMERVVYSDSLRRSMITKGFAQAKKFSWDKTAQQVEEVYRLVGSM